MTSRYLSPIGVDTGVCSISAPCLTVGYINTNFVAGDTVSMAAGNYVAPASPGYFSLTKHFLWSSNSDAVWKPDAAGNSFVMRISGSAPTGTSTWTGVVFDSASHAAQAAEIGDGIANIYTVGMTDVLLKNFTNRGVNLFAKSGTYTFTRCRFVSAVLGAATSGGIINGNLNAGVNAANFSMTVDSPYFELTASSSVAIYGIYLARDTVPLGTVSASVIAPHGTINTHTSNVCRGVYLIGINSATVTGDGGKTLTINSSYTSNESIGIHILGRSATATANDAQVVGNGQTINFFAPAGHGIQLGVSGGSNYMTGGVVSGWRVYGKYYAASTPHGITLGEGTNVLSIGNEVHNAYAGLLMSRTASGTVRQNERAFNCYGSAFYTKGATAGKWLGCSAYFDGALTQRALATIHVDSQAGVNTTSVTYDGCLVVLGTDNAALYTKLLGVKSNCSATFTNCTFIIPDSIASNVALFEIGCTSEGALGGGTTYTATQWETGTAGSVTAANGTGTISVSNNKVLKMPLAICRQIINGAGSQNIPRAPNAIRVS